MASKARSAAGRGAGTEAAPVLPGAAARGASPPWNTAQAPAHSTAASRLKAAQPAAALQPAATMALVGRPVMTMPSPGPQNINPPHAGRPRCASRPMHQLAVPRNTSALATPASMRSSGHTAGQGSASMPVSSTVATSPPRTSVALPGTPPSRRPSHGSAMYKSAPAR